MLDTFQEHLPKLQHELWIWEADGLRLRLHFVLALVSVPSLPIPYTTNFSCISKFSLYSAHSLHFNPYNWTSVTCGVSSGNSQFSYSICAMCTSLFPSFLASNPPLGPVGWAHLDVPVEAGIAATSMSLASSSERVKTWILWNCCRLRDKRAQNLILLVLTDTISILIYC